MTYRRLRRGRRQHDTAADAVSVRRASLEEADALERLAQLDSVHAPSGPLLLAEVGDELSAALCFRMAGCSRTRLTPTRSRSSCLGRARRSCGVESRPAQQSVGRRCRAGSWFGCWQVHRS